MKIQWKKIASVSRPGKSFYRGKANDGTVYSVAQSFLRGLWDVSDDFRHAAFPSFKSSQAARRAVEKINP